MIKVSVIVPIYNVEQYLSRCFDSLINQTYQEFEVICVNDSSPDNSQAIIEQYIQKYPQKFISVINEKNLGLGKTREEGLKRAQGEYIMFVDSDDYLRHDFIETYMNAMMEHSCDVVVGGYIRDTDGKLTEHILPNSPWSILTYASVCTKLFRKDFIEKNHLEFTDIKCGEDIYFSLCAFYHDMTYHVMDYAGYYYYLNRASITGSMNYEKKHEEIMSQLFSIFLERHDITSLSIEKQWMIQYAYLANMINALISFNHGCGIKRMKKKYAFFINDLQIKFPNYKRNPYYFWKIPKGQTKKIRLGVGVTMALLKLHLAKPMFYVISLIRT